jgi:phosphoribosylpyrophosphate synthetase
MNESEETAGAQNDLFLPNWTQHNRPGGIATLGHYYPLKGAEAAKNLLREPRGGYDAGAPADFRAVGRNLGWTRLINALNAERQWPLKRLVALFDPMLAPDIALAVVPTHLAYQAFWPTRTLAQQLATGTRTDATSCLVRHTTIRRITFGGPSTRLLHRQTVRVENPQLVAGRRVLLLDDIAKSGASLLACRELLLEAGATVVQAMALGRVVVGSAE